MAVHGAMGTHVPVAPRPKRSGKFRGEEDKYGTIRGVQCSPEGTRNCLIREGIREVPFTFPGLNGKRYRRRVSRKPSAEFFNHVVRIVALLCLA